MVIKRILLAMKISTTFTKFLMIGIPLMIILMPFVYAANQNAQVKADTTIRGGISKVNTKMNPIFSSSTSYGAKDATVESKDSLIEKVKSGTVQTINGDTHSLVIQVGDKLLSIENNASTTFYFGGGEKADMSDINSNMKIYVFGYITNDASVIAATKIVIANKAILTRR